ncbi:MAG TPA: PAS domain S-box protein [Kiritimatiellia bacterium]|nr:PAS domain S-box protein [Kiritimatiellia bacterium]
MDPSPTNERAAPKLPVPPTLESADEPLRLHAQLLACVRESVVASDLEGRILYWGPGAERMYGYKASEVLCKPYRNFAGAVDPPDETAFRRELLARGYWEGQHLQRRRNGETFWTETHISVFTDDQGQPAGFVGIDRDVSEHKRRELHLAKINECFLNLGEDFTANVDRFVALAGELLQGACALYNRLEDGLLCSLGQWHVPPDFNPRDRPEGHICYDLIRRAPAGALVIRDLPRTDYARTDPNVAAYGLQTYVGQLVRCNGEPVGSLCVVFQKDFEPTGDDRWLLGIIAAAIGVEEGRRRALETLRTSERQQRTFLDATTDLVFLKDDQFRYVFSNRANNEFLGKPEAAIRGRTDFDLMPKEAAAGCRASDEAVLRQGASRVSDETVAGRTYQVLKFPVPLANGRTGIGSYVRDVTERRQAEEKLRINLERLQDIAANIPGAIYQLQTGRTGALEVPYMSSGCEALFERSVAEMDFTGLLFDRMHVGDRALFEHSFATAAQKLERWSLEFRIAAPDGRTKWLRASANPRKLASGAILWNGVLLDVTRLKEAEEARRASEERFQLLVKNSSDVIAVIDAAGAFKYVSPAEEPFSGFRAEELTGKSIRDVIHPDDLERTLQAFQTTVAQPEKSHRIECRHVHKTKGWIPVEVVGQSFLSEPAVKGVIVSVRDVSERHQAEEEMARQLDELRRWYAATLGREGRIAELKREVNALAKRHGENPPYPSAEGSPP